MIGYLPTQALAFLALFVYATHATQAIAFEWKPGFTLLNAITFNVYNFRMQATSEAFYVANQRLLVHPTHETQVRRANVQFGSCQSLDRSSCRHPLHSEH